MSLRSRIVSAQSFNTVATDVLIEIFEYVGLLKDLLTMARTNKLFARTIRNNAHRVFTQLAQDFVFESPIRVTAVQRLPQPSARFDTDRRLKFVACDPQDITMMNLAHNYPVHARVAISDGWATYDKTATNENVLHRFRAITFDTAHSTRKGIALLSRPRQFAAEHLCFERMPTADSLMGKHFSFSRFPNLTSVAVHFADKDLPASWSNDPDIMGLIGKVYLQDGWNRTNFEEIADRLDPDVEVIVVADKTLCLPQTRKATHVEMKLPVRFVQGFFAAGESTGCLNQLRVFDAMVAYITPNHNTMIALLVGIDAISRVLVNIQRIVADVVFDGDWVTSVSMIDEMLLKIDDKHNPRSFPPELVIGLDSRASAVNEAIRTSFTKFFQRLRPQLVINYTKFKSRSVSRNFDFTSLED